MADVDKLLSLIDDEEVVQVTREMVAIPSITHHEGMGMANYLTKWFKDLGIPVRLYPTGDGRANFFADYGARRTVPAGTCSTVIRISSPWMA